MSAGDVKNINNDLDNDLLDDETIDDMYLTFHLGAEVYGVGNWVCYRNCGDSKYY